MSIFRNPFISPTAERDFYSGTMGKKKVETQIYE